MGEYDRVDAGIMGDMTDAPSRGQGRRAIIGLATSIAIATRPRAARADPDIADAYVANATSRAHMRMHIMRSIHIVLRTRSYTTGSTTVLLRYYRYYGSRTSTMHSASAHNMHAITTGSTTGSITRYIPECT